ncbi:DUF2187 family protein [Chryseomicrobium sp. FSL W7-1435]|uniref:YkvS family protein n=1 Tax=Chryseomicrobium sp. FSL W7-1435 TaxID=2921704 RepID=UPI00315AEF11
MKIAEIGNIIEFKDGLQGVVEKVNENSVIVDLTIMENFDELEMEEKTVINHKRYKIIQGSEESDQEPNVDEELEQESDQNQEQ